MATRPARSRSSLWSGRDAVLRQRVAGGALNVLDLARVKINEPKLWTTTTPLLSWFQSSDVLPAAVACLRCVPGVAAFRRPGLVAVLTVTPQPRRHPFGQRRQTVAGPFLQGVIGEGVTGTAALIGQNRDLVH